MQRFHDEDVERKRDGDVCSLCGQGEEKEFALSAIACDGQKCNGAKIRENQVFYELEEEADKHLCRVSHE